MPRKRTKPVPKDQPPVVVTFGKQLRALRNERGLSLMRLAALAETSYNHIGKLERAETEPGLGIVQKLATALGVRLSDLLPEGQSQGDTIRALRGQARGQMNELIERADRPTLLMLCQLASHISSSLARK